MIKERVPKCGYNTSEKQKYREKIYRELLKDMRFGLKRDEKIFTLASSDGAELRYLVKEDDYPATENRAAFSVNRWPIYQDQIMVCNDNPAIVATLKRKYPGIKTYGVDVFSALKKIDTETDKLFVNNKAECYRVMCFNFDLCGTAGTAAKLAEKIHDEVPGILSDDAHVAFTFLNGRDQKGSIPSYYLNGGMGFYYRANIIMRALQYGRQWRKYIRNQSFYSLDYRVYLRDYGKYLSGGKLPMGWVLFMIRRSGYRISSYASSFNKYGESELLLKNDYFNPRLDYKLLVNR
ncbi:MAG: hypothetical protein PHR28_11265 [candidate division Zixibacteria bacterium]|nr:hypothetical protein [candidate division Zixibacteria bacterium]